MSRSLFACRRLVAALGTTLVVSVFSLPTAVVVAQQPEFRADLPEAPETVIEGRQQSIGSQGTAVSGRTELESPNLTPTELDQSGSSVTVITAEQIAQRGGQTNVAEVLRGLAGIDVVRSGQPGNTTTVFLRGANSEHTKVLVDGIPVNDPISVARAYDFGNLMADNIERIEVLRGPQSVLYGSDAIGGVINIITKKGAGRATGRVSAQGGSFSTSNTAANVSGSTGNVYYSAGGSYFDGNGYSTVNGSENDGYHLGTFSSRTGYQIGDRFNADFVVRYNHTNVDTDGFDFTTQQFLDDPNNFSHFTQTSVGVRLHSKNEAGWYEQTTAFYYTFVDRSLSNAADPVYNFDLFGSFRGSTQQIDSRHTIHLLDGDWIGHSITFGGLYQTEIGQQSTLFDSFGFTQLSVIPRNSIDDGAVYGQSQFRVGESWFTTVGVRSDHYNLYGANDTYRATSLYRLPSTNTGFRATLGTGFRAPSVFQAMNPTTLNPDLLPENAKGWDVGIEQPLFGGAVVPSVTYFRTDFDNLIIYFFDPGTFIEQYRNLARAKATGVEFNTLFRLGTQTTITTAYTYMDTVDLSPGSLDFGKPLLRRPGNKFGVTFNRLFYGDRLNLNVTSIFVGQRFDTFQGAYVSLPSYFVMNAGLTYNVSQRFQVFGRIDNLLNEKYQEVYGLNAPRLSGYAGAAVTW